jgi:peptidoglycan/xylan/chitin deacetylase (PgdA/CDA1 family)
MGDWHAHALGRKPLLKPSMILSFDDGLREVYDIIAPILVEKGIPATFFINPEFIDNKGLFFKYKANLVIDRLEKHNYPSSILEVAGSRLDPSYRDKNLLRKALLNLKKEDEELISVMAELVEVDFETFVKIRKPYMSLEQVRKLSQQGFQIGSHSMDHPLFSLLSFDEQIGQVDESIRWIRDNLEQDHRFFAFPFTDEGVGKTFFDRIFREDQPMVDMTFGTAGMKRDPYPFHFQRIPMDVSGTGARIYLKGEYIYYLLKAMVGRNTIRRKN